MNDSELNVNAVLQGDSTSFMCDRASVRFVSTNRDDAVSSYVRSRLEQFEASEPRGWQLALAKVGRLSPSTIAQVKKGTGIGPRTAPGFAKALGFKSFDDLRSAAYRWWETEGKLLAARGNPAVNAAPTPAMGDAVDAVLALHPSTDRERLVRILEAFTHERFAKRDRSWWIQTLLSELRFEDDAEDAAVDARRSRRRPARDTRKHA